MVAYLLYLIFFIKSRYFLKKIFYFVNICDIIDKTENERFKMATIKEQVLDFSEKCDELKNCKFIMATTKIGEILKSIVNSSELYQLFQEVTENYDYVAAQKQCFVTRNDTAVAKSYLVLPDKVGDRLAFIFCLLVEFDNNTINFNEFLQQFYAEDGSYYASFHAFCDDVINSFQSLVLSVFEDELNAITTVNGRYAANPDKASMLSVISMMLASERDYITKATLLSDVEKETAIGILTQIETAVRKDDVRQLDALISGYHYFILYKQCISETVSSLIETLGEYEELI